MIERDLRPRQIVTRQAPKNAAVSVGATQWIHQRGLAQNLKDTFPAKVPVVFVIPQTGSGRAAPPLKGEILAACRSRLPASWSP
jgi:hypothetical protein